MKLNMRFRFINELSIYKFWCISSSSCNIFCQSANLKMLTYINTFYLSIYFTLSTIGNVIFLRYCTYWLQWSNAWKKQQRSLEFKKQFWEAWTDFLRSLSSEVHVILMNSTMYYFKVKTGDIWLIINAAEISKLIFKILSKNMQRNCMILTKSFYVMPC